MKLSKNTILQIENLIKTCKFADIAELKVLDGIASAINKSKTILMISDFVITESTDGFALTRLDLFMSRFNLIKDIPDYEINADLKTKQSVLDANGKEISPEMELISRIIFKAKRIKAEYKCSLPQAVKAPSAVKDEFNKKISLNEEFVLTLIKASAAADNEIIKINYTDNKLSFILSDINKDQIVLDIDSDVLDENDLIYNEDFEFSYNIKSIFQLLKNTDNYNIEIGVKGILKIVVNSLSFYALPANI